MKGKNLLLGLLAGLLFFGYGCKKDEIAPETSRNVPKATISGTLWADLDVGSDALGYESVPSGIKVIARVWAPDLATGINNDRIPQTYLLFEGQTNGSGEYSIDVDASTQGMNVTLFPDDFLYDQKQGLHPIDSTVLPPIRRVYSAGTHVVSVIAGGNTIRDIAYSASK